MEDRYKFLVIPYKNDSLLKTGLMRLCIIAILLYLTIGFNNVIYATEFQQVAVTGTISNQQGVPLVGVTVSVKGTTLGTISDASGKYTLINAPQNATLVFSFIGMVSQEIPLNGKTKIDVTMAETTVNLEEVVVVGYGTTKKVNLTGAVSQVSSEVLASRPIANLGQGLQGAIANLQVTMSNYAPGSGANFNIRGYTSINGGSPLVLVDGVVQDPNLLNPEDVESVSVLKDASSAAVYGARAAYGVVLITTKKGGKDQKPTLRISTSYDVNTQFRLPLKVNSMQLIQWLNQANINTTGSPFYDQRAIDHITAYYNDPVNNLPVYYDPAIDLTGRYNYCGNFDWNKILYKNGTQEQLTATLSGGTNKTQYYVSWGTSNQGGILKVFNDGYLRNNLNVNVNSDIFDWLSVSAKTKYAYTYQSHPSNNTSGGYMNYDLSPLFPPYLPDGAVSGQGTLTNPVAVGKYAGYDRTRVNDLFLTGAITIRPLKGLNINADYTFNPYSSNHTLYVRTFLEEHADGTTNPYAWSSPNSDREDNNNNYYNAINAYIDYSLSISKHNFKILLGYNQETKTTKSFGAIRTMLINNDLPAINRAIGVMTINGAASLWAVQGGFYRFNYDYDGKYLLELDGRYDGASKFPKGDRFAFFPSASGAWVVSKEAFWDNLKQYVSSIKIRGSYGSLGNQAVSGDFPYISSYGITTAPTTPSAGANAAAYIFSGATPICILPGGLISPSFTWEKVNQVDAGVDLGFFKDKLNINFDWYERQTIGMLTAGQTLPAVLGTGVPTQNAANLKTVGWELNVAWRHNIGNFSYNISGNVYDALATITKFTNPTGLISSNYVGKKVGEIWGYDSNGLFQTAADITASPSQQQAYSGVWLPGDVKYVDRNNDGVITRGANTLEDPGDQHIIGNNTPRYQFGINLGAGWKGIDASVFMQGTAKRDYWIGNDAYFGGNGSTSWIPFQWNMNYWSTDNTNGFLPNSYESGWGAGAHGNRLTSTRYLENAAYMRLKQITVGYTLPEKWIKKLAMSQLRVYTTVQNIATFTKLCPIFDPENINQGAYPIPLSYNFGLNVTF